MSTQHTPDRLIQSVNIIRDANGLGAIADNPETARRLAACWNSCEGISTEHLEDDAPRKLLEDRNQLLAQRDELLEALREVLPMLEHMLMIRGEPQPGSIGHKARTAIAKATGEAA